jgi:hypothetical protein
MRCGTECSFQRARPRRGVHDLHRNEGLRVSWTIIKNWSETSRYALDVTEKSAQIWRRDRPCSLHRRRYAHWPSAEAKPEALRHLLRYFVSGAEGMTRQEDAHMKDELVAEAARVENEIAEAVAVDGTLAGGLIKSLIAVRLEILRTTRAALRQRVLADEMGAPLTIELPATTPAPEIAARLAVEIEGQTRLLDAARAEAARFSGGLVHALKLSTIATQEQSLSMLRQRYLVALYGLWVPSSNVAADVGGGKSSTTAEPMPSERPSKSVILEVQLLDKKFAEQQYQEYIFFDIQFAAPGLKRPARAVKGRLKLSDLFGETKLAIDWAIERPLRPGESFVEKGQGFEYNKFMQAHQWVNATALRNMTAAFEVTNILYGDGTREDFA